MNYGHARWNHKKKSLAFVKKKKKLYNKNGQSMFCSQRDALWYFGCGFGAAGTKESWVARRCNAMSCGQLSITFSKEINFSFQCLKITRWMFNFAKIQIYLLFVVFEEFSNTAKCKLVSYLLLSGNKLARFWFSHLCTFTKRRLCCGSSKVHRASWHRPQNERF